MKRVDLLKLASGLMAVGNVEGSMKWTYAISKNRKKIKDEIETIQDVQKKIEDGRIELCKELAEKDDKGNPVMLEMKDEKDAVINTEFSIKDRTKLVEYLNKKNEEFKKFLDEEIKVELHKMKLSEIPDKGMTPNMLEGIEAIIEE
ncbi:MAG TPA: hypothetical protein PLE74_01250 [Candidatus Cloacimonadota bacterium]|nr:hypothetical protein [Candidatus Cloacimonadota bacterium]